MAAPYSLSVRHHTTGRTVKAVLRQLAAQEKVWDTSGTPAFETYNTASIGNYGIAMTELGTASRLHVGNIPTATAGLYILEYYDCATGTLQETDEPLELPTIVNWDGTAVVSTFNSVVGNVFTYSPVDSEVTAQFGEIIRGSGIKFQFTAVPATAVDGDYFEARLQYAAPRSSYYVYTVANGKLEVNEATGVILVNPTTTETDSLPTDIPIKCELWRIGSGDDNTTRVAKVKFKVDDSLRGAA